MKPKSGLRGSVLYGAKGFTVDELLISIIIMTVVGTLMTPALMEWRQRLTCREAARAVISTLRAARAKAIATNREHKVEFESANGRYRILQGNRANNSIDWNTIIENWALLPMGVNLDANVGSIHLNTNGTASSGTISIQDRTRVTKYRVVVASTGRIRVR